VAIDIFIFTVLSFLVTVVVNIITGQVGIVLYVFHELYSVVITEQCVLHTADTEK